MATAGVHIVILSTLLLCCDTGEGMGLCEFRRVFPTNNENCTPVKSIPVTRTGPICPPNMEYAQCTCNGTCETPKQCSCKSTDSKTCVCPDGFLMKEDECVWGEQCGCFKEGEGVIPALESIVNFDCSEKCTCRENQLTCNSTYKCSPDASCMEREGVRKCYCNEGYTGNGETCVLYKDCYDAYKAGQNTDAIYTIHPLDWPGLPFNVSCDMTSNGGGWTVFQRRIDGVTDFYRNWENYANGFGVLDGDFWLGNRKLHFLTNQRIYKLRIDMITANHISALVEYASFRLEDENNKYRLWLKIGSEGSTETDDTEMGYIDVSPFSTYDQDNSGCSKSCAEIHRSAWWYTNKTCNIGCWCGHHCSYVDDDSGCCNEQGSHIVCTSINVNGDYKGGNGENVYYKPIGCNLNFTEMKLRPLI